MKSYRIILITLITLYFAPVVLAGRTGETTITNLIVKETFIEIYTSAADDCGSNPNRWHLLTSHSNFNAMYSGLLASKVSGKAVDIVGNNTCGTGEDVSWGYVVK